MYMLLEKGITPDMLNDERIMYKEDIVDIAAAERLRIKGNIKREKKRESRSRAKAKLAKMRGH